MRIYWPSPVRVCLTRNWVPIRNLLLVRASWSRNRRCRLLSPDPILYWFSLRNKLTTSNVPGPKELWPVIKSPRKRMIRLKEKSLSCYRLLWRALASSSKRIALWIPWVMYRTNSIMINPRKKLRRQPSEKAQVLRIVLSTQDHLAENIKKIIHKSTGQTILMRRLQRNKVLILTMIPKIGALFRSKGTFLMAQRQSPSLKEKILSLEPLN